MSDSTPFALPSAGLAADDDALLRRGEKFNGLGQRLIITPDTVEAKKPKLIGYTRATTFIGAIEDSTALSKWRTRLILEGCMEEEVNFTNRMLEALFHRTNAETAGADPAAAAKEFRAQLDEIAESAFHFAGGHDAADYGTALHELADRWHTDVLTDWFIQETEDRWPGIVDDFAAYCEAWEAFVEATGAEIVATEALLVNDQLKVAGRTDVILKARVLPTDQRARRCILDIKTGSIDNGLRLSQQLDMYSSSKLYDPETGIRTSARLRRDIGIVAHVPRGERRAEFHVVQLAPGRAANKLCLQIRAARRKVPGIMTRFAS